MGLRIATNVPSLAVQKNVEAHTQELNKSFQRLSSGERIASSGDDAAGMAIGENLHAQIRSLQQAKRNANDGISLVQTAEGSLNEVSDILVRLRELGVQAASDTIGDHERAMVDKEYQTLKSEIDRLSKVTNYNGTPLLSGEGKELSLHVGAFGGPDNVIKWDAGATNVATNALGIDGINVAQREDAADSLDKIDQAIQKVNEQRAGLGAMQNRLHSTSNSLSSMTENLSEARSRIADTDIAAESSQLVKNSILQQAGIAVLAQANAAPNAATRLL